MESNIQKTVVWCLTIAVVVWLFVYRICDCVEAVTFKEVEMAIASKEGSGSEYWRGVYDGMVKKHDQVTDLREGK